LSRGGYLAEGPIILATVGGPLSNNQKKVEK